MSYLRPIGDDAAKAALAVNGTILIAMIGIPFAMIILTDRPRRKRRK